MRLRALDVVLGRGPPPTEEWLEENARLADSTSTAWDVRAHLSCPVSNFLLAALGWIEQLPILWFFFNLSAHTTTNKSVSIIIPIIGIY